MTGDQEVVRAYRRSVGFELDANGTRFRRSFGSEGDFQQETYPSRSGFSRESKTG